MILGASGAGKSILAIRLIAAGARLVADDRTCIRTGRGTVPLWAEAPPSLPACVEARGLGLIAQPGFGPVPLRAVIDLDAAPETARLPERRRIDVLGHMVALFHPRRDGSLAEPLMLAVAGIAPQEP